FRAPADHAKSTAYEDIAFRCSIGLFTIRPEFELARLVDACRAELEKEHATVLGTYKPKPNVRILTHIQCVPTPLLAGSTILDLSFGYTFARTVGNRLFYYD